VGPGQQEKTALNSWIYYPLLIMGEKCTENSCLAFILLFLETMSTFVISPPKCGGNMASMPLIFFFGAASVQATEPKWWVSERNYPLAKVAEQSLRTGKCFLRKPVRIQCTEHDSSWISLQRILCYFTHGPENLRVCSLDF